MLQDLRRESEELLRYWGELERRIGQGGVADISNLLALHDRLVQALAAVSKQELLWAEERVKRLISELATVGKSLEAVRRLKTLSGEDGGSSGTSCD